MAQPDDKGKLEIAVRILEMNWLHQMEVDDFKNEMVITE